MLLPLAGPEAVALADVEMDDREVVNRSSNVEPLAGPVVVPAPPAGPRAAEEVGGVGANVDEL
jgi:hypothetical protein